MTSVDFLFKSVQRFDNGQDDAHEGATSRPRNSESCATSVAVSMSGGLRQAVEAHAKQDCRSVGGWIVLALHEVVNRRDDY